MRGAEETHNLCVRRAVATSDTDSVLKGRLKAYDRSKYGMEAPGSRPSPILLLSGPVSLLDNIGSLEVLNKRPLVPIVKNKSN